MLAFMAGIFLSLFIAEAEMIPGNINCLLPLPGAYKAMS
jgi:hypothetical protein